MKARKCDRCGGFYDYTRKRDVTLNFLTECNGPKTDRMSKKIDLCPKCQKKLIEWYNKVEFEPLHEKEEKNGRNKKDYRE